MRSGTRGAGGTLLRIFAHAFSVAALRLGTVQIAPTRNAPRIITLRMRIDPLLRPHRRVLEVNKCGWRARSNRFYQRSHVTPRRNSAVRARADLKDDTIAD
jgi:hypothetical protein